LQNAKSDQNDKEEQSLQTTRAKEIEETPASPDPGGSSSPDCQILPIIIPTERSIDLSQEKCSRRQQIKSKTIPVITLTEHTKNISLPIDPDTDDITFSEWDMLEESERHMKNKNDWQSTTSDNDVAIAAKLVSSNLPQKINDSSKNYTLGSRNVPMSSRFTVVEKNKLNLDISGDASRSESPVNVPEVRLNSPDPEILFAKSRIASPKSKDNHNISKSILKPPSIPLLLSPPASSKPSLSMEDLAKLLNDENDAEKKADKADENITKYKKILSKQEMNLANKDDKAVKNFSEAVRENEKRWEEINYNVKFTTRKSISSMGTTSIVKSNEIKKSLYQSNDHRSISQISSPNSKFQELRYADNYEKYPRQRDVHGHETIKDKLSNVNETSPQIHQNVVNKSDERNSSLYQRRPNIASEGWKETGTTRLESEFLIEGIDYYNSHMNQMHWSSTSDQFNNTQWVQSSVYGGMSNPSLQSSTQHPYQHPIEFRSSQFPSNLSTGPRPLISSTVRSQDINHAIRPENIREEISPLRSASGFSVTPQYRSFQIGQGSYDPAFDRPSAEYSHVRSTWGETPNRMNDVAYENMISCGIQIENSAISYPRSNTPCPWGSRDRDRCNRGRGRDGYYNERNRTEIRLTFNRDMRRSRDGHSDRENLSNRFANRDPRVRGSQDHNVTNSNQTKEISGSVRDPRLAKDKHTNMPIKAKDNIQNERDTRKRLPIIPPFSPTKTMTPIKEKSKLQKSEKEPEKEKAEKLLKDKMQSPLESLYGAIDTKSCQNSSLQKFRIPKIKRSEPLQSNYITNESKGSEGSSSKSLHVKNNNKKGNVLRSENIKEDTNAEVSSSSDSNNVMENLIQLKQNDISSLVEEMNRNEVKIGEADSVMNDSKFNDIVTDKGKNELETDGVKSKEEVTQELIEALIKKSFESGEGKKLVEQAKLIQKLGQALKAKKLKKIKKIIDSESESSNSDKEAIEPRKTQARKKRRVIMSDSSDDECLAERLGILSTNIDASNERKKLIPVTSTSTESLKEKVGRTIALNNLDEALAKDVTKTASNKSLENNSEKHNVQANDNNKITNMQLEKEIEIKNDRLGNNNKKIDIRLKSDKQINNSLNIIQDKHNNKEKTQTEDKVDRVNRILEEKSKNTDSTKQSLNLNKNPSDCIVPIIPNVANSRADDISDDKPKVKTKRRNSLEMLQEDIREMFISEDVVTATGYRMCRMSKEGFASGINSNTSSNNFKKDEMLSSTFDKKIVEPNFETNESNNPKFKKALRSNKSKTKNKKDVKRAAVRFCSKELIFNSDSEEDQPLALRTEKLLTNTDNNVPDKEENHEEESCDTLRKSKRVLYKDSVKEPRVVVEKADIVKIDSSKVMFDSSSDESFGIDVSELAAAVDISPQPVSNQEKQSDQDLMDTVINTKRQRIVRNGKRNMKQKKSFIADKNEDGISLTDEESVMSDTSMSSSTIVENKTNGSAAKTCTKEELLSNILVGLVPATTEKASTDKGSEADFDDDTNDLVNIETNAKKSSVKKKKKRSSWQMGIVSTKKKKRKTGSLISLKTTQTNIEKRNETSISMNVVESDRTLLEDNNITMTEKALTKSSIDKYLANTDANVDPINSRMICDNVKLLINNPDDVANDIKLSNAALSESSNIGRESFSEESFLSSEENKSIVNSEKKMEKTESIKNSIAMPSNTDMIAMNFRKSSKIVYDEVMEEIFRKITIDRLMDYVWTGQDKYKCLLCIFIGKNIVHHYKMNHPEREVLIARLKLVDAKAAIADIENDRMKSVETIGKICKFHCRFCCFVTEGAADIAIEAFYEHCTTHTGEYRFHCNSCPYQAVAKASMRTHYYKMCRKHNDTFSESASEDDVPKEGEIYGYLCRECNYVQLKRNNVEVHVEFWHRDKKNTEILKINMSATIEVAVNCNETSQKPIPINTEKLFAEETKLEFSKVKNVDDKDVLEINIIKTRESQENNSNISKECNIHESKTKKNIQIKKEETNEKSRVSQGETESSVNTDNLSIFVCPPELENKEVEIQRERQKMMQEVANNIGILLKNFSKSGLSIIDKLQDKMRTDTIVNSIPECNPMQSNATNALETIDSSLSVTYSTAESLESVIIKKNTLCRSNSQEDRSSFTEEHSVIDKSTVANNVDDKTDTKIWDPLSTMDSHKKDDESDGEISDNERSAPLFESDSSSEQSDSEPTDVNMILKETSNMSILSSRDPMLTTIQRLVAQLQSAKPLETMSEKFENKMDIKCDSASLIPKSPDVASSINANHSLIENIDHVEISERVSMSCNDSSVNPPKNFIRFRRLSGDMLSMPAQFSHDRENTRAASAGIQPYSIFFIFYSKQLCNIKQFIY